jgi:hypothetical protein
MDRRKTAIPFILWFVLQFSRAVAADSVPESTSSAALPPPGPRCLSDPKTLHRIEQNQMAHPKSARRYDGYRDVLKTASDLEIFVRLAYAETLAANCETKNAEISSLIVNVIGNRVIKRRSDIRGMVFELAQFASSLHLYSNSRYRDFLCPENQRLWSEVHKKSEDFLRAGSGPLSASTVHYFLYKHDPKWPKEPWILAEDPVSAVGSARDCIRTFQNPHWK